MIQIRVFTHPVCKTCPAAIKLAESMAKLYPDVEVRVISLGSPQGREEAKREGILSVPTILVEHHRFVGLPERAALIRTIEQARREAENT